MAKKYLIGERKLADIDRAIARTLVARRNTEIEQRRDDVNVTRLPAILVDRGPNDEDDYEDNRYWFVSADISNTEDPIDEAARVEMAAQVNDESPSGNQDRRIWATASNLGESSEQSHDLPVDGTQQVIVERVYDARSPGGWRWVFSVMLMASVPVTGSFYAHGSVVSRNVAAIDENETWVEAIRSLAPDAGGELRDVAVFNDELYAVGLFNISGSGFAVVIKFDAESKTWSAVGGHDFASGVTGCVVHGGALYVCGQAISGDNVQSYNGSSWSAVSDGITTPYGLDIWNGSLICYGVSGGDGLNSISILSGGSWTGIGGGIQTGASPGIVFGICDWLGDLVAVGIFDTAGGSAATNAAKWNGSAWSALDTTDVAAGGLRACYYHAGHETLYAGPYQGGVLYKYSTGGSKFVAATAESLLTFLDTGGTQGIYALGELPGGDLAVCGAFVRRNTTAFGGHIPEMLICRFDGTNYHHISGGLGVNPYIAAGSNGGAGVVHRYRRLTLPFADDLDAGVVAGSFANTNTGYSMGVARMGRRRWVPMGQGLRRSSGGSELEVWAACKTPIGTVCVGTFDGFVNLDGKGDANSGSASGVARFNGGAWYPIESAPVCNGAWDVRFIDGEIWIVGDFSDMVIVVDPADETYEVRATDADEGGGNKFTVCGFDSRVWLGGRLYVGADSNARVYDPMSSAWIDASAGDMLEFRKFRTGDLGNGPRMFGVGQDSGSGAGSVRQHDGTGWSEVGGTGNRVTGLAYDCAVITDDSGSHLVVVGALSINGGPDVAAAIYSDGTWGALLESLPPSGSAYAVRFNRKHNGGAAEIFGDFGFLPDSITQALNAMRVTELVPEAVAFGGLSSIVWGVQH